MIGLLVGKSLRMKMVTHGIYFPKPHNLSLITSKRQTQTEGDSIFSKLCATGVSLTKLFYNVKIMKNKERIKNVT